MGISIPPTIAKTLYSGTITTDTYSDAVSVVPATEASIVVVVGTVTGTSPTLAPVIQISHDGTNWASRRVIVDTATQGSLTRLTAPTVEGKIKTAGTYRAYIQGNLGKYLRIFWDVGGTSPSFPVTAYGVFK
jgi:hypothetical protein